MKTNTPTDTELQLGHRFLSNIERVGRKIQCVKAQDRIWQRTDLGWDSRHGLEARLHCREARIVCDGDGYCVDRAQHIP